MKLISLTGTAFITGVVALSGCATTSETQGTAAGSTATNTATAEDQATAELREHHRHHHHGGITQFISMSLDTLGNDEAKKPQIEKIQSDLRVCMKPAREINRSLLGVISDGVAAGTIDTAKVDITIAQLTPAAIAERDCSVVALNQLHAALSPEERAALVDKVDAHWEVWRAENHEAKVDDKDKTSRLGELQTELNLTPEQVEKMSANLTTASSGLNGSFDSKKVDEHLEAFSKAFASDKFDAKSITANANAHLATHGAKRMAIFYETVTPLLTPEQRTKLAEHLKEHASHQPAVSQR